MTEGYELQPEKENYSEASTSAPNQILILWNVRGMEGDGLTLEKEIWSFHLNSMLVTLWESEIFFSHFLENNPHSLLLIGF